MNGKSLLTKASSQPDDVSQSVLRERGRTEDSLLREF